MRFIMRAIQALAMVGLLANLVVGVSELAWPVHRLPNTSMLDFESPSFGKQVRGVTNTVAEAVGRIYMPALLFVACEIAVRFDHWLGQHTEDEE